MTRSRSQRTVFNGIQSTLCICSQNTSVTVEHQCRPCRLRSGKPHSKHLATLFEQPPRGQSAREVTCVNLSPALWLLLHVASKNQSMNREPASPRMLSPSPPSAPSAPEITSAAVVAPDPPPACQRIYLGAGRRKKKDKQRRTD